MYYIDGSLRIGASHFSEKRIKIISGEQFVPLYLASVSAEPLSGTITVRNSSDNITRTIYLLESTRNNRLQSRDRSVRQDCYTDIKKQLTRELHTPTVKEYSCNFMEGNAGSSWGYIPLVFSGQNTLVRPDGNNDYHYRPGLLIRLQQQTQYLVKGVKYKFDKLTLQPKPSPLCLTIVKAKHLSLIRAGLKLQKPITLPYSDITILVATNANNDSVYCEYLAPIVKEASVNVKVQYVTPEEMLPYLVLPTTPSRDATEALTRAQTTTSKAVVEPCI